jgi:predicted metal-binding protein
MHYKSEIDKFGIEIGYESLLIEKDAITDRNIRKRYKCNATICGKNYACPPFSPTIDQFKYESIFVYILSAEKEDVWELFAKLTFEYGKKLEASLNGVCFIAGPCRICDPCKAEAGEPCPYPEEMRYSFTGVGLDTEKLNRFLKRKITWDDKCTSAVGGCVTNKKEADLESLFKILQNL